ncbi:MAG: DUF5666 domain-containing protein [Candidatus Sulfotelmatobacter sp.]|jgi:hypothetical protein
MNGKKVFSIVLISLTSAGGAGFAPSCFASSAGPQAQGQSAPGQVAIAKSIGTIKSINGTALTLTPASGPEVAVTIQPNARILRLAPGDKDLKNASTMQLQDLQVGDTVRVRGLASGVNAIAALEVVVITHSAVEAVSDQIRQDWQKRGLGGVVSAVDPSAGTVTISISSLGGKKTIAVRTSKSTVIRRYAPDSFKPEDAKVITLQEVKVDDQLRARGNRNSDGSELAAEEIFTGAFPYVEGLVKAVDASAGTISVQDVLSRKTVQLKTTADSQLHQIPAEMAQRFAMRLKATRAPGATGAAANLPSGSSPPAGANGQAAQSGVPSGGVGQGGGGMGGGNHAGGGFDFQRLLDQTPALALTDLHKGDAVAVLATEGTPTGGSTVIKLFSGVEPILEAAPNGSQAMMLTPWSLGGAPNGDAANP